LAAVEVKVRDLEAAPVSSAAPARVGELVFALGNPLGITGAVATGIIHAIGPVDGLEYLDWIQADIQLAPGNSGGPLADTRGRVLGVNSMICRGLGLAVPASSVERFLRGEKEQPELGVTVQPVSTNNTLGLFVYDVVRGSSAERAGLTTGDVLIGAGGRRFLRPVDLPIALRQTRAGQQIPIEYLRGGRHRSVDVKVR
jgi:serine protease Do